MRSTAAWTAASALSALAALLFTLATAHAAPGDTIALPVRDALPALPVQDEDRTDKRTKFQHWIDADRDGCTTRAKVLLVEAVAAPGQSTGCHLSGVLQRGPRPRHRPPGPALRGMGCKTAHSPKRRSPGDMMTRISGSPGLPPNSAF